MLKVLVLRIFSHDQVYVSRFKTLKTFIGKFGIYQMTKTKIASHNLDCTSVLGPGYTMQHYSTNMDVASVLMRKGPDTTMNVHLFFIIVKLYSQHPLIQRPDISNFHQLEQIFWSLEHLLLNRNKIRPIIRTFS